ncbi:MAG: MarR family transcriptional regulator [Magnetovibrio sp.]|nr:MarR family transcriptional regulator [Magnetovibrio sp.]
MVDGLTPTQYAAMAKLDELGSCSQNKLGRLTAMDAATIKGVVDRLAKRNLVDSRPDADDGRRRIVELTRKGRGVIEQAIPLAQEITEETLRPLPPAHRITFLKLLTRLR